MIIDLISGTIVVRGCLDIATAPQLRLTAEVVSAETLSAGPLILDLCDVSFIDCAGLSALLAVKARAHAMSTPLMIAGASEAVTFLLEATGTETQFTVTRAEVPATARE